MDTNHALYFRKGNSSMTTKTVWAAYFSATNTTKKWSRKSPGGCLSRLPAPWKSMTSPTRRPEKRPKPLRREIWWYSERQSMPAGFPTYSSASWPPSQGNGALAVPVVCYGNRNYDDALMELRNTLEAGGFHTVAGRGILLPARLLPHPGGRPAGPQRSHHCLGICRPNLPQKWRPLPPWKAFPRLP